MWYVLCPDPPSPWGWCYILLAIPNIDTCATYKHNEHEFELQARDNYGQTWSLGIEGSFAHVLINCSRQLNCEAILYTHTQMNVLLKRPRAQWLCNTDWTSTAHLWDFQLHLCHRLYSRQADLHTYSPRMLWASLFDADEVFWYLYTVSFTSSCVRA